MKTQGEDGRPRAKDGGLGGIQEVADVWPPGPRDEETPVVQLPARGPSSWPRERTDGDAGPDRSPRACPCGHTPGLLPLSAYGLVATHFSLPDHEAPFSSLAPVTRRALCWNLLPPLPGVRVPLTSAPLPSPAPRTMPGAGLPLPGRDILPDHDCTCFSVTPVGTRAGSGPEARGVTRSPELSAPAPWPARGRKRHAEERGTLGI